MEQDQPEASPAEGHQRGIEARKNAEQSLIRILSSRKDAANLRFIGQFGKIMAYKFQ
jgi:hypothetical protein